MNSACPECGDQFDTRKGMKIHYSQAHGERLADRVCENCGDEYPSWRSEQKYCSPECSQDAQREPVELICEFCNSPFEVEPREAEQRKHCSDLCRSYNQRRSGELTGYPPKARYYLRALNLGEEQILCDLYTEYDLSPRRLANLTPYTSYSIRKVLEDNGVYTDAAGPDYEPAIRKMVSESNPEDFGLSPLGSRPANTEVSD